MYKNRFYLFYFFLICPATISIISDLSSWFNYQKHIWEYYLPKTYIKNRRNGLKKSFYCRKFRIIKLLH